MNLLRLLPLLVTTSLLADPVDIGADRELMIDHHLIDHLDGLTLELQKPTNAGHALDFNDPWDRDASGYVTVLEDHGLYRMYYRGGPADSTAGKDEGSTSFFCYAESKDGINWVKPKLGLVAFNGSKENNILLAPSPSEDPYTQSLAPFIDNRPGVPANERYKAIGGQWPQGLYVSVSPDGIHWKKWRDEPVFSNGAFDSQNVAFWSESEECYVLYFRVFSGWTDYSPDQKWRTTGFRTISRATSPDLIHWSEPERMSFGPTPLEQLYTNHTRISARRRSPSPPRCASWPAATSSAAMNFPPKASARTSSASSAAPTISPTRFPIPCS